MKYEVRYQIGGEEHAVTIDADDAANAVQVVQSEYQGEEQVFELIQVQYLEDTSSLAIEDQPVVTTN